MPDLAIPLIAEIRASTKIISLFDAFATAVKVGQHFAVKFGGQVSLLEAENLRHVSANSKVPVPKVLATMTEPETACNFIVLEYIDSQGLKEIWKFLTLAEKLNVSKEIQNAPDNLRKLQSLGYFGALNRHRFPDRVFWTPEENPETSGPFETEGELNEEIIRRLKAFEPTSHISLLRTLILNTLKGHHTVFTHGDLHPKNILMSRYPEYWGICNDTIAGRFRPDWLKLAQRIMPIYTTKYLVLQAIRSLLFYWMWLDI
ncbi:kinase-like domain-containing protein [Biscogniauxia marginata]|nr:kinase-like domain-containing protein [Biscogniauxia marginata]